MKEKSSNLHIELKEQPRMIETIDATSQELPFEAEEGQVIYTERTRNKRMNSFISNNYERLRKEFRGKGLQFCYMPILGKETLKYNAPHLTEEEREEMAKEWPNIAEYINDKRIEKPCLVFGVKAKEKDNECKTILKAIEIKTKWYKPKKKTFEEAAHEIAQEINKARTERGGERIRYSLADEPLNENEKRTEEYADERFDKESQLLIEEIRQRVEALRSKGVNTIFLHKIIDEGEKLSELRITKDFRIFLPDYGNEEIKMAALPKSIFILFLRHPEGIRFKELGDYYEELLGIYKGMNPNGTEEKQEQSVKDATDPYGNSINEKCARIREAFVEKFDDRLAKNYYVTGKRGEPKKITIDRTMVKWEQ